MGTLTPECEYDSNPISGSAVLALCQRDVILGRGAEGVQETLCF